MKQLNNALFFLLLVFSSSSAMSVSLRKGAPANSTLFQRGYLQKRSNPSQTVGLGGTIPTTASFYITIGLGTPYQVFDVIVDTGSSDMLIYGSSCSNNCDSGGANLYKLQSSSTSSEVACSSELSCSNTQCSGQDACEFDDTYGDGSELAGIFVQDDLTVGEYSEIVVQFGYIEEASSNFASSPEDGIWGLAYDSLARVTPTGFDNIVNQIKITNSFSMCLQEGDSSMTFGEDFSSNSNFQFVPITQTTFYVIQMQDIAVAGTSVGLDPTIYNSGTGTIVDSGTTGLALPPTAYSAVIRLIQQTEPKVQESTQQGSFYCFRTTASAIASYPTITISLANSVTLSIPPTAYMLASGNDYCVGIASNPDGDGTILGDVVMQNYHVVFDRANTQIGFGALSTCPDKTDFNSTIIPQNSSSQTNIGHLYAFMALALLIIMSV